MLAGVDLGKRERKRQARRVTSTPAHEIICEYYVVQRIVPRKDLAGLRVFMTLVRFFQGQG